MPFFDQRPSHTYIHPLNDATTTDAEEIDADMAFEG